VSVWYAFFITRLKHTDMKNPNSNKTSSSTKAAMPRAQGNRQRPENKDNLDHREGEENDMKGDDVTHNKKQTKAKHLKEKSK
jgi:hypothetical protein